MKKSENNILRMMIVLWTYITYLVIVLAAQNVLYVYIGHRHWIGGLVIAMIAIGFIAFTHSIRKKH